MRKQLKALKQIPRTLLNILKWKKISYEAEYLCILCTKNSFLKDAYL